MLLDAELGDSEFVLHNIPVASNSKYLGFTITPRPLDQVFLNLSPLLKVKI